MCSRLNVFNKYQGKNISLQMEMCCFFLTSNNCELSCCLTLHPPSVGWYIMGCESEPLPSYRYLRTRSYTINLKTTFTSGSLYLLSHVLILSPHKLNSYRHMLCPCAQLIYGPAGHLRRYGDLPPLDVFLDWSYPSGLQRFSHRG